MTGTRLDNGDEGSAIQSHAAPPTEGIFYLVRFPEGWEPVARRFDGIPGMGHPTFWRQHVVTRLSRRWAPVLNRSVPDIESDLRSCEYGFPRGRVVRKGRRYRIFFGNDIEPFMKINRSDIERLFAVSGLAQWSEDDHEHCLLPDKEHVRKTLRLRENWKHVDPDRSLA